MRAIVFFLLFPSLAFGQWVSTSRQRTFEKFWPASEDATLIQLKERKPRFFEEEKIQSKYGASNVNSDFPWAWAFGFHAKVKNGSTIRFVDFPDEGKIKVWKEFGRHKWTYPEGTTFGEILLVKDSKGWSHTFEVRTRLRTARGWRANAWRPFPTHEALQARIGDLWPDWSDDRQLARLMHGESTIEEDYFELGGLKRFKPQAMMTTLTPLAEDKVQALLRTPFRSSIGAEWRQGEINAPSTHADFHVVPYRYLGGFIRVDSIECMECHKHAGNFITSTQGHTGWLRGSDGIFSFDITDGRGLRSDLVRAGILESR